MDVEISRYSSLTGKQGGSTSFLIRVVVGSIICHAETLVKRGVTDDARFINVYRATARQLASALGARPEVSVGEVTPRTIELVLYPGRSKTFLKVRIAIAVEERLGKSSLPVRIGKLLVELP
jgi:hypothetical protein